MKQVHENHFSMFRTAVEVISRFDAELHTIPALVTLYQRLKDKVSEIEDLLELQDRKLKGIAENKQNIRGRMAELALQVKGMIMAYASSIDDPELYERVNYSKSKIMHSRDELALVYCEQIRVAADGLMSELAPYGMTLPIQNDLIHSIDDYRSNLEMPDAAIALRKSYTLQLDHLILETNTMLRKEFDKAMMAVMNSHPKFYMAYINGRTIKDRSGRRKEVIELDNPATISGLVTDKDGFGVADAKVIIENTKLHTTTDDDGEYLIENVPEGTFNLLVIMDGYTEARENQLKVNKGDEIIRDFTLEVKTDDDPTEEPDS